MFASRTYILAALLVTALLGAAQQPMSRRGASSRSDATGPDAKKEEKTEVKEGNAWTLTFPLGDHLESKIDTATYNYQRNSIPSMTTDAYATTGNFGAEGIDLLYFSRPRTETFFFEDALAKWMPTFAKEKFYNVYIPTTILTYNFGGGRENHQDLLRADFAGNVNRRIGIGANLEYLYSKGCYENQAAKHLNFGLSTYYLGDRYELQAFFNHFNSLNKENGGITDDLYITDPAQLQGGVDKIEPKSIPTRLNAAHTRLNGAEFFMTHAYKVGFWKEVQVNDTLTRDEYVPVTRFIYSFDYRTRKHMFRNTNTSQAEEFWENRYLNPLGTQEYASYREITNSIGIEMIEGFQKWAKFGLSAYVSFQNRRFRQPTFYGLPELTEEETAQLTPLPDNFHCPTSTSQNLLWVGGRLQKDQGSILRYQANARFGLVGDVAGDLDIDGTIRTRFRMLGDTVGITARGAFSNLAPSYLLQHYVSNHFAWDNHFGKTRTFKVDGELSVPWTKTLLKAGVENVQNLVYFGPDALPRQHGGSVQVFSATLDQRLRFGIWNWNNTITYQTSSNQDVLPLPALTIYSNMFLKFIAFKVLKLQIGVDCDYYTSYNSLLYQPATMSFHVQGDSKVKTGNYPFCNVYFNARLYKVRFFVMMSHINQGWFSKNYFSLPHYPLNPRRLEFGLSVDFTD